MKIQAPRSNKIEKASTPPAIMLKKNFERVKGKPSSEVNKSAVAASSTPRRQEALSEKSRLIGCERQARGESGEWEGEGGISRIRKLQKGYLRWREYPRRMWERV